MTRAAVAALALMIVVRAPLAAQAEPAQAPGGQLVVGGILGGAAGMVALGFAGALIGGNRCTDPGNPDSCKGFEGVLWGAAAGHTVGIPLGVHVFNRRSGSFTKSLLASAAIFGVGAAIGVGSNNDKVLAGAALTVPIAQFVSSIAIERATARRRTR